MMQDEMRNGFTALRPITALMPNTDADTFANRRAKQISRNAIMHYKRMDGEIKKLRVQHQERSDGKLQKEIDGLRATLKAKEDEM